MTRILLFNVKHWKNAVVSILLYGCTTLALTKRMEKKLDSNYTRMLRAILNNSWRQHPQKKLLGHLPPFMKSIKVRRTRHAGHSWRSKDELISDTLLWTSSHGRAKARQPARVYIQQVCADTGYSQEDLRERWTIETGGEWGSGRTVLAARHNDDDKDKIVFWVIYILKW